MVQWQLRDPQDLGRSGRPLYHDRSRQVTIAHGGRSSPHSGASPIKHYRRTTRARARTSPSRSTSMSQYVPGERADRSTTAAAGNWAT
jgi:hypothetical protein